jgi:hypothetical protein
METEVSLPCSLRPTTGLNYGLDDWGLILCRGNDGCFLFATAFKPALDLTQPLSQRVLRTLITLRVKRQGIEADHSPPSSAVVKKRRGTMPPVHQYVFIV